MIQEAVPKWDNTTQPKELKRQEEDVSGNCKEYSELSSIVMRAAAGNGRKDCNFGGPFL